MLTAVSLRNVSDGYRDNAVVICVNIKHLPRYSEIFGFALIRNLIISKYVLVNNFDKQMKTLLRLLAAAPEGILAVACASCPAPLFAAVPQSIIAQEKQQS